MKYHIRPFLAGLFFGVVLGAAIVVIVQPRNESVTIERLKFKGNEDATTTLLDCCEALKEERKKQRKEKRK